MKKINKQDQPVKKTTNYAPDSHSKFCNRCYVHNAGCPLTGKSHKSKTCNV